MADLKHELSLFLLAELVARGITVYEFAKRAGLADQTARNYCDGVTEPTLSKLYAIDRGLGWPPGTLAVRLGERLTRSILCQVD